MNKELYEKYAEYYINKFKDDKNLIISKKWRTDDILHIDIYTNLPSFEFFMGIYSNMLTFDGICVCDHGIDFENIETEDPKRIYSCIDEESELILKFIKEGLFIFAYKGEDRVLSGSLDQLNRKKFLQHLNIQNLYIQEAGSNRPPFSEITKIHLLDFYGNIIYEYNAKTADTVDECEKDI